MGKAKGVGVWQLKISAKCCVRRDTLWKGFSFVELWKGQKEKKKKTYLSEFYFFNFQISFQDQLKKKPFQPILKNALSFPFDKHFLKCPLKEKKFRLEVEIPERKLRSGLHWLASVWYALWEFTQVRYMLASVSLSCLLRWRGQMAVVT